MTSEWMALAHIHRGWITNVYHHKNQNALIAATDRGQVFRYSLRKDKWDKYHSGLKNGPSSSIAVFPVETAMNYKTNEIFFIYNRYQQQNTSIATLKLNNDKTKNHIKSLGESNYGISQTIGSSAIVIKNDLHLIGGLNGNHLKWNKNTNQFDSLHENVASNINIHVNASKLVKVGDRIISFGGYHDRQFLDCMMEYDIIKDAWKRLKIEMPRAMRDFGCTSAVNDRYILLFGGRHTNGIELDDIYIYSVLDGAFRKSRVKCPRKGKCHAIAVNGTGKDELSVYGYVRYQWKKSEINEQLFPPRYLIDVIKRYYQKEYIHLFRSGFAGNHHWRKEVFDIM